MATIINTPREEAPRDESGTGVIIGVILVILLAILLFAFGLPYLRNASAPSRSGATSESNLQVPSTNAPVTNAPAPGTGSGASGSAGGSVSGSGSVSGGASIQ